MLMPGQGDRHLPGSELFPFLDPKAAPLKGRECVPLLALCPEALQSICSDPSVAVGEAGDVQDRMIFVAQGEV